MPQIPTQGTLAERVLAFYRANPSEEMEAIEIAQRFGCSVNSVPTLLATCLRDGLLVRRKDSMDAWQYIAGPHLLRGTASSAPPAASATAAAPRATNRRSALPPLDPSTLTVRRDVAPPPRPDLRRAAYFAALDKLDAPHSALDLPRAYRGAIAKAAQAYIALPANAAKRFTFHQHPEQPQALCVVLREA